MKTLDSKISKNSNQIRAIINEIEKSIPVISREVAKVEYYY